MRKPILAILATILASLACAQIVITPALPVSPTQTLAVRPTSTALPLSFVTASQSLNVRERAGTYERVIGALYHDNTVVMTGKCSDDPAGWAEIVWQDGTAWVNADFLTKNKCSEE